MPAPRHTSRFTLALGYALLCGACVPIAHTVTVAPAVEGTYRNEDGTPVAGAPLALTRVYADSTCASPSHRTTTDAAGRFAFPQTRKRERFVLLLPVDRLFQFTVCGVGNATGALYSTNYLHAVPDATSVNCIQMETPEPTTGKRTSCTGRRLPRRNGGGR